MFFHVRAFHDVILSKSSQRPMRLSSARRHCEVGTTTFSQPVSRAKLFSSFFSLLSSSACAISHLFWSRERKHLPAHFPSSDTGSYVGTSDLVPVCARQQDAFPRRPHGDNNILQESPLEGDWLPTPPGSTVCLTSNGHLLHQQAHTSTSRLEALASTLLR